MEAPFQVMRWCLPCGLVGALALQGCRDSSGTGDDFPLPAQIGGLPPVEGQDLLDGSFAGTGVFEAFFFEERTPVRVAVDRFSRPVIAGIGRQPSGLRVLRLTEAGTSDTTFGTNGVFLLPDDPATTAFALRADDCLIDALDRILLLCTRTTTGDAQRAVVVRLDLDGILDASFGDQGLAVLEPTADATETQAVSLRGDALGGFLACVNEIGPEGPRMTVVRFEENGSLDAGFGEGGVARGPEEEASLGVRAVPDLAGRVVVGGSLPTGVGRVALWRFDADGAPDTGFGVGGIVTQSDRHAGVEVGAVDAATDSTGRILVLGQRSRDLREIEAWPSQLVDFKTDEPPVFDAIVWRFLPDGSRDPSFADGGVKVVAFNSGPYFSVSRGSGGGDHFDAAAGLFLEGDERIVIAGWSDPATWETHIGWATFGPTRPFLVRLVSSGALDRAFHGSGHAQLGWDSVASAAEAFRRGHPTSITRDVQGRWVLAGGSEGGSSQRVWRIAP